jgi:hypothetical protein
MEKNGERTPQAHELAEFVQRADTLPPVLLDTEDLDNTHIGRRTTRLEGCRRCCENYLELSSNFILYHH